MTVEEVAAEDVFKGASERAVSGAGTCRETE